MASTGVYTLVDYHQNTGKEGLGMNFLSQQPFPIYHLLLAALRQRNRRVVTTIRKQVTCYFHFDVIGVSRGDVELERVHTKFNDRRPYVSDLSER